MKSSPVVTLLTADRTSQEVTDWGARIAWVVGLLLFIALVYWLMREGWKWRALLQSDLPPLPEAPAGPAPSAPSSVPALTLTGRYHGSTTAGQWLERIVAHGLGTRSRAELTLTGHGIEVRRPGASDFFIPAGRLRGARLDKGIAGKVVTEGGLLVITWEHGGRLLDSGFRSDRAAGHPAWVEAIDQLSGDTPGRPTDARPADARLTGRAPDADAAPYDRTEAPEAASARGTTPEAPEAASARGTTPEAPEAASARGTTPEAPEKGAR